MASACVGSGSADRYPGAHLHGGPRIAAKLGTVPTCWSDQHRTSHGQRCARLDRGTDSYSVLDAFCHTHIDQYTYQHANAQRNPFANPDPHANLDPDIYGDTYGDTHTDANTATRHTDCAYRYPNSLAHGPATSSL